MTATSGTPADPHAGHRRPRSRGVPAPRRRPPHSLADEARLHWAAMYPLPRMLISGAVLVALAYGVVAFFVLVPARLGMAVYLWGIPLLLGLGILPFTRGEPGDQTTVHHPSRPAHHMSEDEFEALEDRVDHLGDEPPRVLPASDGAPAASEPGFEEIVADAIDGLPPRFAHALDHVAVTVSDQGAVQRRNGRRQPLYGLYVGYAARGPFVIGAPSGDAQPDRIVIFRDTLTHDFGDDPQRLRAAVTRTLRHELAHHLGYDEPGVRELGL